MKKNTKQHIAYCAIVMIILGTPSIAISQVSTSTNGENVTMVEYGTSTIKQGSFVQVGENSWEERGLKGQVRKLREERKRDMWTLYLKDDYASLRIDLHTKKIFYSDKNTLEREQYIIRSASSKISPPLVESITMMQTHRGLYSSGNQDHNEYPESNFELICTRKSNTTDTPYQVSDIPSFECRSKYVKDITWGGGSVTPKGTWVGPANTADAVWKGNGGKVSGRIPTLGEFEIVLYCDEVSLNQPESGACMLVKINLEKKTATQDFNTYNTYDYKFNVVKVNGKAF
ncbi:MAG: hypothetical protein ACJAX3_002777 [Patiriisocius sp.]|jgi:hypothetical protein